MSVSAFLIHTREPTPHLSEALKSQDFDLQVVVAGGETSVDFYREAHPNALCLSSIQARFGWLPADCTVPILPATADDIRALAPIENVVLQALDRLNFSDQSVQQLRSVYLELVGIWRSLLNHFKPQAVIFRGSPQLGYDTILYEMCRIEKRPCVLFGLVPFQDRALCLSHFNDIPQLTSQELNSPLPPDAPKEERRPGISVELDARFNHIHKNLRGLRWPWLIKRFVHGPILQQQAPSTRFFNHPTPRAIWVRWQDFRGGLWAREIYKAYLKQTTPVDFTQKYIYFPLHRQPETSTYVLGGVFSDQLHVLKILSAALPQGWKLLIKEHPSQFHFPLGAIKGRHLDFYKALAKLSNVQFCPLETSARELTTRAQAVATITGTTGWEALKQDIPVILFGMPWYANAPGVLRVASIESCQQAIEKIANKEVQLSQQDHQRYLYWMLHKYTIPAATVYSHDAHREISAQDSATSLSTAARNKLIEQGLQF